MERNEISIHELSVWLALKRAGKWITNDELFAMVDGVRPRTVRTHTKKFVELGLVDLAEVFPGHRYRISEMASKRNKAYVLRLDAAIEQFGLNDHAWGEP